MLHPPLSLPQTVTHQDCWFDSSSFDHSIIRSLHHLPVSICLSVFCTTSVLCPWTVSLTYSVFAARCIASYAEACLCPLDRRELIATPLSQRDDVASQASAAQVQPHTHGDRALPRLLTSSSSPLVRQSAIVHSRQRESAAQPPRSPQSVPLSALRRPQHAAITAAAATAAVP